MEAIVVLLVFIAVIAVAGVLFCVWAAIAVTRALVRAVMPKRTVRANINGVGQACVHRDCSSDNPAFARYCRRCGRPLPALLRLVGTRAA